MTKNEMILTLPALYQPKLILFVGGLEAITIEKRLIMKLAKSVAR